MRVPSGLVMEPPSCADSERMLNPVLAISRPLESVYVNGFATQEHSRAMQALSAKTEVSILISAYVDGSSAVGKWFG